MFRKLGACTDFTKKYIYVVIQLHVRKHEDAVQRLSTKKTCEILHKRKKNIFSLSIINHYTYMYHVFYYFFIHLAYYT